jgi:hypothetical protein
MRKWRANNPDKRSQYNRKYREANREKLRLASSLYYEKKREKLLEDKKFYYNAKRKEICKKLRENYATRAEYIRAYNRSKREKLRRSVMAMLGDHCVCCGEREWAFLEIDHINGGGSKHVSEKGTWGVLRDVRDHPTRAKEFRVLCSNCNKARSRLGKCPHGNC